MSTVGSSLSQNQSSSTFFMSESALAKEFMVYFFSAGLIRFLKISSLRTVSNPTLSRKDPP